MRWIILVATVVFLVTVAGVWALISYDYERRTRVADAYVKVCEAKGGTVVFNGRYMECLK